MGGGSTRDRFRLSGRYPENRGDNCFALLRETGMFAEDYAELLEGVEG
jgi:hypothetical protein